MAKTYFLDNQAGVRQLAPSDPSDSSDSILAANGGSLATQQYDEPVDSNPTRTSTGTFSVEVNVTAAASNTQMRMRLARLNAGGTVQATSASTAYQSTASTGLKTFQLTDPALGTWAADDRLRAILEVQNNNAHGGSAGPTYSTGTTSAEVSTPFTDSAPPIPFVGVGALSFGNGATLQPAIPSGVQQGDMLLAICICRGEGGATDGTSSTVDYTFPAGWQVIPGDAKSFRHNGVDDDMTLQVAFKLAEAGESAPTIGCDTTAQGWGSYIAAYRGASGVFDLNAVAEQHFQNNFTQGAVTTNTANARVVSVIAGSWFQASLVAGSEQGFTARASGASYYNTSFNDVGLGLADKSIASAGSVTMPSWQLSSSNPFVGLKFALKVDQGGQSAAVGQAPDAESAQSLAKLKSRAAGQPADAESAQAIGKQKALLLGQAVDSEAAGALGKSKAAAIGQAASAESAQAIESPGSTVPVGQASDADTAQAIGRSKVRELGQVVDGEPVVLLVGNDNAPDGTTTVDDESASNHSISVDSSDPVYDDAQAPAGMRTAIDFDGDDQLSVPSHPDLAFGAGDFTVEMMLRTRSVSGGFMNLYCFSGVVSGNAHYIGFQDNDLYFADGNGRFIEGTDALQVDTWYHVALARVAGVTRLFLNGTKVGSDYSDSNNYAQTVTFLGRNGFWNADGLTGWLSNIRVTKGRGRYSANFTPPELPYGTARALRVVKSLELGQASSTEIAQAIPVPADELGQTTEANTAQAVGRSKARELGQASGPESAQALAAQKFAPLGQVVEADAAQAIAKSKVLAVGQAVDGAAAQPLAAAKSAALAQVSEGASAGAIAKSKARQAGQAAEGSTAQAVTMGLVLTVGQAIESSTASAVTTRKQKAAGQAAESSVAGAAARELMRLTWLNLQVPDSDTLPLNAAGEPNTAQVFGRMKVKGIGQAIESSPSSAIAPLKVRVIGQTTEANAPQVIASLKSRVIGQVSEANASQGFDVLGAASVGQAIESSQALAMTVLVSTAVVELPTLLGGGARSRSKVDEWRDIDFWRDEAIRVEDKLQKQRMRRKAAEEEKRKREREQRRLRALRRAQDFVNRYGEDSK